MSGAELLGEQQFLVFSCIFFHHLSKNCTQVWGRAQQCSGLHRLQQEGYKFDSRSCVSAGSSWDSSSLPQSKGAASNAVWPLHCVWAPIGLCVDPVLTWELEPERRSTGWEWILLGQLKAHVLLLLTKLYTWYTSEKLFFFYIKVHPKVPTMELFLSNSKESPY